MRTPENDSNLCPIEPGSDYNSLGESITWWRKQYDEMGIVHDLTDSYALLKKVNPILSIKDELGGES